LPLIHVVVALAEEGDTENCALPETQEPKPHAAAAALAACGVEITAKVAFGWRVGQSEGEAAPHALVEVLLLVLLLVAAAAKNRELVGRRQEAGGPVMGTHPGGQAAAAEVAEFRRPPPPAASGTTPLSPTRVMSQGEDRGELGAAAMGLLTMGSAPVPSVTRRASEKVNPAGRERGG